MDLKEQLIVNDDLDLENGGGETSIKRLIAGNALPVTATAEKSEAVLDSQARFQLLKDFCTNLQEVILGTKLAVLFPAVPLAMAADSYNFGRTWIFGLSLLGLTPLAERVSFLTEQIAFVTGPTVGGLLNATCGNATELIIALFALHRNKIDVLKFSLLGSILSNLLLVLGTSLLFGGLSNLNKDQTFNRKMANLTSLLLLLGLLCHTLPAMFRYASAPSEPAKPSDDDGPLIRFSRVCSVVMLVAYIAYIFFQLKTHRPLSDLQEEDDEDEEEEEEEAVVGFWSSFIWLVGMTIMIAILSEYVVGTIEDASKSWGISVSFIGIILLPIVGNAAEHAGSVIFAVKNKLDIALAIALGSAAQISIFVVPLSVIVGWCMGIRMDLDFGLLETLSLAFTIIITLFTLQDGSSHYIKGVILLLCYVAISACFFVQHSPQS